VPAAAVDESDRRRSGNAFGDCAEILDGSHALRGLRLEAPRTLGRSSEDAATAETKGRGVLQTRSHGWQVYKGAPCLSTGRHWPGGRPAISGNSFRIFGASPAILIRFASEMDEFEPGEVVELLKSPAAKGIVVSVSGLFIEVKWVVASGMQGQTTTHHPDELCKVREVPHPRPTHDSV